MYIITKNKLISSDYYRVGVNHQSSTEPVVPEVKHQYCLYGAMIIVCAAIIIPLILQVTKW